MVGAAEAAGGVAGTEETAPPLAVSSEVDEAGEAGISPGPPPAAEEPVASDEADTTDPWSRAIGVLARREASRVESFM